MKKFLSAFLSCTMLLTSFSFANNDSEKEKYEKYLGIARVITYIKNGNKNVHYALINGKEQAVNIGNTLVFENLYSLKQINRDPKKYRIVSVEPYNGNNFGFGVNAYDYKKVYNPNAPRDFFAWYI